MMLRVVLRFIVYFVMMIHNENLSMHYTEKNSAVEIKNFGILNLIARNIDCGYTLEPPHQGGSNEYPQSMFWSKNNKNRYTPVYP